MKYIAFVLILIVLSYITCEERGYFSCIKIKILGLPDEIKAKDRGQRIILILYGNLCANCPSGDAIYSLRGEKNLAVVVPNDFSLSDIENIRRAFSLRCQIIRGGQKIDQILRHFAKCKKWETWKNNVIVYALGNKIINFKKF